MTVHIFVSSTWLDLQPERAAVEAALQRMRETKFIGMEYFGSRDDTTRQVSLEEVDRSQVYVGVFAGRYGSGITEDEYRRARELNLPCFPYLKDEATIPAAWRESDPEKASKLDSLLSDLRQTHTVTPFKNPDDLAARVTADLHRWLFDFYLTPRLERAARGEMPRQEAGALMDSIKDWDALPPSLTRKLRDAGYVIASGAGSVAVGGDVRGSVITTGSNNTIYFTKTDAVPQGVGLQEFTALIAQMRELLQTAGMTEDDRDTVETNLKTVEKESEKEKPRLKLIESSLSSVSSIVESAKGVGSVLIKLAPMLGQALEYARRLFP